MTFDYYRIERKAALAKLSHWERTVPNFIDSFAVIGHGGVADEVSRVCREKKIDLVITMTHGRQGVSRLLHGNLAEEMVRLAPCPVLVLHLNQEAEVAVAV